jgi:hypothetical protein
MSVSRLLPHGVPYLSGLGKYIFLSGLVLPDTGGGAVHKPIRPQQRQDDIPHDGEVIVVAFVLEGECFSVRNAGKIVGSEQTFYYLMYVLQRVVSLLYGGFLKGKFYFHQGTPPVIG